MSGARTRMRAAGYSPARLDAALTALLPERSTARLCVAFSGGVDSTALLAALARLRPPPAALRAVHVDHGLHRQSVRWSRQCRALARQLGVPLTVVRVHVEHAPGGSLEEAARTARYRALAAGLKRGEVLLTAHHQDDQLETVLLQLLRGCGLAGLAAMAPSAPFATSALLRPLLGFSRAELAAWVGAEGLPVSEDLSNLDERFDRNYLRRQVLPAVRARWRGAAGAVARTARLAAEGQQLLEALARSDLEPASDGAALSVKALRRLSPARRRNALRLWIGAHGGPLPDARRLEQIAGPVLEARPDAQPQVLWGGTRLVRHADLLWLEPLAAVSGRVPPGAEVPWDVRTSMRCELPGGCGTLELMADAHGPLDLDALGTSLTVRWRSGGERLRLRPGGARRALKSLLQEARVPPAQRARLPLLYQGDRLLAAADLWLDESVRARRGARRRARLRWKKTPHAGR